MACSQDKKEYVEEFLDYCHLSSWDDRILMDCFWSELDKNISLLMPDEDFSWTLEKYLDIVLSLCGSPFTFGEIKDNIGTQPSQSTPTLLMSSIFYPEPIPTMDPEPEPTADTGPHAHPSR